MFSPGDLRFAYLFGSLLFVPVWLFLYWRNPASRREMLVMSGLFTVSIGVPLEFLLYSRDWWHPLTVTNTAIGVEDVIYSIGNGGYMAVLYTTVFRGHIRKRAAAPGWVARLAPLAAMLLIPLVLACAAGWTAFPAATVGSLAALGLVLWTRPDLTRVAVGSALIGTLLALPVYLALEALFPGIVAATWDLPHLSGVLVLGVPVEDLLWYLYTSALWSTYFKFAAGVEVSRSRRSATMSSESVPYGYAS